MFTRLYLAVAVILTVLAAPSRGQEQPVSAFLAELWPDAHAKGINRATFDTAMKGFAPDQRVIAATRRQPEYGKPVGDYVNAIVSKRRIADAQLKGREWAKTFDAVEKKFQVERWVLLALWGMESDFGSEKDRWDVFRSLATLAYVKYRDPYFRNELFVAMRIMQDNRISREKMISSWAGAMGQTQFMPSNFVDYAIDFSGDGRADIWGNVPDVLASTANYLRKWKWNPALPWGFEVHVPDGFDYMRSRGSFAEWRALGVRRANGKWFCYYTAHPGNKGFDYARTSDDLLHWSVERVVAARGRSGDGPYSAECPFVVEPQPGVLAPAELTDAGQRLYEIVGHTLSALEEFRLTCAGQPLELAIGDRVVDRGMVPEDVDEAHGRELAGHALLEAAQADLAAARGVVAVGLDQHADPARVHHAAIGEIEHQQGVAGLGFG